MPSELLRLPGGPALSGFRIEKLLARLRALEPAVTALESRFVHVVALDRPLAAPERLVLEQLLRYGSRAAGARASEGG